MQRRLRLRASAGREALTPLRECWRRAALAAVDEAGRGCLAGPVVAATVVLPYPCRLRGLADSKALTAEARERLCQTIEERALAFAVAASQPEEIDRVNVLEATYLAMRRAIASLPSVPEMVAVDGYPVHDLPLRQVALIDGDAKFAPISAASVVAKVYRDRMMRRYDAEYPGYGFAAHKGYGTPQHLEALQMLGPCPIHRLTFEPLLALARVQLKLGSGAGREQ